MVNVLLLGITAIYSFTAAVNLGVGSYVLFFKKITRSNFICGIMAFIISIWLMINGIMTLNNDNYSIIVSFTYLKYSLIMFVPPLVVLFVFSLGEEEWIFEKKYIPLLFFVPSFILASVIITNPYHKLYWQDFTYEPINGILTIKETRGVFAWLSSIFIFFYLVTTFFYLVFLTLRTLNERNNELPFQLVMLMLGILIPVIFFLLTQFGLFPYQIDIVSISFSIGTLFFSLGLVKYHFLTVLPLASIYLINNIGIGIIVLDKYYRIVEINEEAKKLVIQEHVDYYGRNFFDILRKEKHMGPYKFTINKFEEIISKMDDPSKIVKNNELEVELLHPQDPQNQWIKVLLNPLLNQNKTKVIGYIFLLKDITIEKEIEESREKDLKLNKVLLSMLTHDFNNLIQVIISYIELGKELEPKKEIIDIFDRLELKSRQMEERINKIIEFLKLRQKALTIVKPVNIIKSIEDNLIILYDFILEKGIKIEKNYPKDLFCYTLANVALNTIWYNLLSNAIRHSPRSGTITITVEKEIIEEIDRYWVVKIRDRGEGIPTKMMEDLFQPFKRGPKGSIGLGLFTAKTAVETFRGNIQVENLSDGGARFIVRLPIYRIGKSNNNYLLKTDS